MSRPDRAAPTGRTAAARPVSPGPAAPPGRGGLPGTPPPSREATRLAQVNPRLPQSPSRTGGQRHRWRGAHALSRPGRGQRQPGWEGRTSRPWPRARPGPLLDGCLPAGPGSAPRRRGSFWGTSDTRSAAPRTPQRKPSRQGAHGTARRTRSPLPPATRAGFHLTTRTGSVMTAGPRPTGVAQSRARGCGRPRPGPGRLSEGSRGTWCSARTHGPPRRPRSQRPAFTRRTRAAWDTGSLGAARRA